MSNQICAHYPLTVGATILTAAVYFNAQTIDDVEVSSATIISQISVLGLADASPIWIMCLLRLISVEPRPRDLEIAAQNATE